jgi:hypothetical protein
MTHAFAPAPAAGKQTVAGKIVSDELERCPVLSCPAESSWSMTVVEVAGIALVVLVDAPPICSAALASADAVQLQVQLKVQLQKLRVKVQQ